MKTYIEKLKGTLYDLIHEMSAHYWLYVSDPERNFSRERKLPFEKVLAMLISMGGGSLRNELIDYFRCSADMASAPRRFSPDVLCTTSVNWLPLT